MVPRRSLQLSTLSNKFVLVSTMGKSLRHLPAMKKPVKKAKGKDNKKKALTTESLSKAIADRQYVDTMKCISKHLERNKPLAPRVLHMLQTNMLDPEIEADEGRLPPCVNKYRLLSLQNIQDLVREIGAKSPIDKPVIQGLLQTKTKTGAMQTFTMWMRFQENSALHSMVFSVLAEEFVRTATLHREFIDKSTYVGNGKQGRFAGMIAEFGKHGVYSFADLNQ